MTLTSGVDGALAGHEFITLRSVVERAAIAPPNLKFTPTILIVE